MLSGDKVSWSKATGLYAFISGIIMLAQIFQTSSPQPEILERIIRLTSLLNNLFSFLLIAHFFNWDQVIKNRKKPLSITDSVMNMLKSAKAVILMITIILVY